MILDKIVAKKKMQIEQEKLIMQREELIEKCKDRIDDEKKSFASAIRINGKISIIAEVKKASPSKGIIREDFKPVDIAKEYLNAGVEAISVLTEKDFFMGNDNYLKEISKTVPLPILRKDFIIDEWQIYQSLLIGARAILLIVSILNDNQLKKFLETAQSLDLDCLVEVHNEEELKRALFAGALIVGINNRDLKTFEVDLKTTEKLMKQINNEIITVSESGIKNYSDVKLLKEIGVDAVLIGETFMRAESMAKKLEELRPS